MKFYIYFLLLSSICFSQDLTVKFALKLTKPNDYCSVTKKFTLNQNTNQSIFQLDDIRNIHQFKYADKASVVSDKDSIVAYMIDENNIEFLYQEKCFKDFRNNYQIYNYNIGMSLKCYNVKDDLDLFDWKLVNEKDTLIANFKCKKAQTKFRGREYIAFYTNEIANQGGPWKFDGLPGFILKVYSIDGYLSIDTESVLFNAAFKQTVNNPFADKKTMAFDDLKTEIVKREKIAFAKAKSKSENNLLKTVISPFIGIEDIGLNEPRTYE
jgi:GLPGLI family protein